MHQSRIGERLSLIRPMARCLPLVLCALSTGCCLLTSKATNGTSVPSPTPTASTAAAAMSVTSGPLSAGAAAVTISPGSGVPLAGFGGTPRREFDPVTIPLNLLLATGGICFDPTPSTAATLFKPTTGTRDAIKARALVLANGQEKIAIVKVDAIASSRQLRDDLLPTATTLGIDSENVVLLASHTHSGPGSISNLRLWQLIATDCYVASVYEGVLRGAQAALQQANTALQPAKLGIGAMMEAGASKNRSDSGGAYDQELGVVKITTLTGVPIAALFNFAVHGTSLGASHMRFSADCMGAMERVVETKLPGAVAIFTNGAEGDVAPEFGGDAGVDQEGTIIGEDVFGLWPTIATKSSVVLRAAFTDVTMPPATYNACSGCVPVFGTGTTLCNMIPGNPLTVRLDPNWLPKKLPFQAIRIDDTVFAAIPGEPITAIGLDIKTRAKAKGFTRGFVLALANDHGSYFTTLNKYNACKYEGQATLYGPTTGQVVVDSADAVMTQVQ